MTPDPTPSDLARLRASHASDCAVHNEPALPNGPCDCGAVMTEEDLKRAAELLDDPDAEDCERFASRYGRALLNALSSERTARQEAEARAEAAERERDEAQDRADELERDAEIVSVEFEKDCWIAVRSLLQRVGFDEFDQGVTAQDATDILWVAIRDREARATALEAQLAAAREALEEARRQLYGLCEATIDECTPIAARDQEGKPGAYARGRKVEAKAIARAMGEVFRELIAALAPHPEKEEADHAR